MNESYTQKLTVAESAGTQKSSEMESYAVVRVMEFGFIDL
jgi:hypothetical protein